MEVESSSLYLVCFVVFRLAVCGFLSVVWLLFLVQNDVKNNFQTLGKKIGPCHSFGKGLGRFLSLGERGIESSLVLFHFKDIQGKIMKRVQLFLHKVDSVPLHISLCLSLSYRRFIS